MIVQVLMPALSPTMTEGKIARWLKKEGDDIKSGMVIAEIETDKATMEVEAVDEGVLGRVLVSEGTEGVKVNAPIALIGKKGDDFAGFVPPAPKTGGDSAAASSKPAATNSSPVAGGNPVGRNSASGPGQNGSSVQAPAGGFVPRAQHGRIIASPLARRMASQRGLDLRHINGSGPNGRIVVKDVDRPQTVQQSVQAAAPKGPDARELADLLGMKYQKQSNSTIRKVIAKRLSESKQTVPHFYLTTDCRIDGLLAVRKSVNEKGTKVSVNDLVVKAAALALREVPAANSSWTDSDILIYDDVDISLAVATDHGLMTPIVKNADKKSVQDISSEIKDLAGRARENKLKPAEFQGGTFTVSNLGMFGITHFEAIINPPQSCILAVGAGVEQPVVKDGKMEIGTVMKVTLSVDHRSVDGAVGAQYLQAFKALIETPEKLVA